MNWLIHVFENPFLLMALFAALAASVTSGIVGSYVVVKRIVFICGSIAHSVLGGMGAFLYLKMRFSLDWLHPMYGALLVAIASAYLMGTIHLRFREREDTLIAALWATGMSIGVICIALTPNASTELIHFLFGNILWVTQTDLILLSGLACLVVLTAIICHRKFLALCFDEKTISLQGISPKMYYFLLLGMIALSTVLLIQVVGALLVIALLAIPPAIASAYTRRLSTMIAWAVGLCSLVTLSGLIASYHLNWPPGATIACLAALGYLVNLPLSKKARLRS